MFRTIYTESESEELIQKLREELFYVPRPLMIFKIFGKSIQLPRDKGFFGDVYEDGSTPLYRYGGDWYPAVEEWTPTLKLIRDKLNETHGQYCNHVVVNRYVNGSDHIGWHHDKTPDFVDKASVLTVSFGDDRTFQIRNLKTKEITSFKTGNGTVSDLDWNTNIYNKHRIAKTAKIVNERISLTYRSIKSRRSKEDNDKDRIRINEFNK